MRLTVLFRRKMLDRELEAEIDSHLQLHIDENLEAGMTPVEARRQAIIALGGVEQAKEQYRDRRGLPPLEAFLQDVQFAGRMLRKQPAFTLSALAMLSLGLALTAGTYTVFNGLFVRGWSVPDSDRVFRVEASRKVQPAAGIIFDGLSLGAYRHISAHARTSEYVGYWFDNMRIRAGRSAEPTVAGTVVVSDNFITALRIPLQQGTTPSVTPGAPAAILITDRMWRRIFGADPAIVGRNAWVQDVPVTIAGVTAAGFDSLGEWLVEVIVPMSKVGEVDPSPDTLENLDEGQCCIRIAGRLRDGRTHEEARAELQILSAQYRQSVRQPELSVRLTDTTQGESLSDEASVVAVFSLVSAGIMLVFLLTCTNVGNLFLARSLSRRSEIAVRLSLGATRTRIVQQLVVEGLVLASISGAAAFLATMAVPPLFRLIDDEEAIAAMFASDWRVAAFTSVFVILTCLIVSLAPALHTSRIAWRSAGAGVPQATGRLRRGILSSQIAVATVLVLSATLLTRGIERALATPADFALHTTTAAILQLPPGRLWDAAAARQLQTALAEEARASDVPIGLTGLDPGGGSGLGVFYTRLRVPQSEALFGAHVVPVAEAAPQILGLRLASGRWPSTDPAALEAVVNRTLAENMWGGDALGRPVAVGFAGDRVYTVVGIAADAHLTAFDRVEPVIHFAPLPISLPVLVARTARNVDARLKQVVGSVDPALIVSIVPLSQPFEQTLRQARVGATVAGGLAAIAIALAIVGIFSVFAYLVEERHHEIGVRLALGASRTHVGLAILHATRNAVGGGLLVGLALAVAAGIMLRGFLFGLSPVDPVSYAIVALVLVASAAIATAIPVRRAVRIAPVTALRAE
jgi:predicted permease